MYGPQRFPPEVYIPARDDQELQLLVDLLITLYIFALLKSQELIIKALLEEMPITITLWPKC